MSLIDITAPAIEPVSIADVKLSARMDADNTSLDSQITLIIRALRRMAESRLQRRIITQTVELVLDDFPEAEIDLLLPDVQAITSVKYIDSTGTEQTLAESAYSLDPSFTPCFLFPAHGTDWPATYDTANALRVRYTVGYGATADSVPEDIRLWIIAHAVQAARNPDGFSLDNLRPLPFIDQLLNDQRVIRVV